MGDVPHGRRREDPRRYRRVGVDGAHRSAPGDPVDRRLDLPKAVESFKTLVNACIEHKFGLTTGGHNIRIDIIDNDIRAACVTLGSNLLKDETAKYNALLRQ